LNKLAIVNGEEDDLSQAQRLLQYLYPGSHELKITDEPEIMMVRLKIHLQNLTEKDETLIVENITIKSLLPAGLAGI
jgi:hypothetical protein